MTPTDPHWDAFRADVQMLYDEGCRGVDSKVPALTALVQALPDDFGSHDILEVLRWVIGGFGGGLWSNTMTTLLGVDETRGQFKYERWGACAKLPNQYVSGDSFRNGEINGRLLIHVILDEVTDSLVALADKYNFHYETKKTKTVSRPVVHADARQPITKPAPAKKEKLIVDSATSSEGSAYRDSPYGDKETWERAQELRRKRQAATPSPGLA